MRLRSVLDASRARVLRSSTSFLQGWRWCRCTLVVMISIFDLLNDTSVLISEILLANVNVKVVSICANADSLDPGPR